MRIILSWSTRKVCAAMEIKIKISPGLYHLPDGQKIDVVAGSSVELCLRELGEWFPGVKAAIFTDDGRLLEHIGIYLNLKSLSPGELATPVKDGDEIFIIPMIFGG